MAWSFLRNRTTMWCSNPISECISKGYEISILKRYLQSHIHWNIVHNSQDMEIILVVRDEWENTLWDYRYRYGYTHILAIYKYKLMKNIKYIMLYIGIYMWKWSESRSVVSNSSRLHGLLLLPGKSHGQRSVVGYSPQGRKESDTTERLRFHFHLSPGQNTGVGSLSLLQGIFPTQGSNPGLPRCRRILYQLSHRESPHIYVYLYIPLLFEQHGFELCGRHRETNTTWYHLYVES